MADSEIGNQGGFTTTACRSWYCTRVCALCGLVLMWIIRVASANSQQMAIRRSDPDDPHQYQPTQCANPGAVPRPASGGGESALVADLGISHGSYLRSSLYAATTSLLLRADPGL